MSSSSSLLFPQLEGLFDFVSDMWNFKFSLIVEKKSPSRTVNWVALCGRFSFSPRGSDKRNSKELCNIFGLTIEGQKARGEREKDTKKIEVFKQEIYILFFVGERATPKVEVTMSKIKMRKVNSHWGEKCEKFFLQKQDFFRRFENIKSFKLRFCINRDSFDSIYCWISFSHYSIFTCARARSSSGEKEVTKEVKIVAIEAHCCLHWQLSLPPAMLSMLFSRHLSVCMESECGSDVL